MQILFKYLLMFTISFMTLPLNSKQLNYFKQENTTKTIMDDMYNYFTYLLSENYGNKSEEELFYIFLSDYYNYWMTINENKEAKFITIKNIEELKKINKKLFIRDSLHYYYFYPDIELINENEYKKKQERLESESNNNTVYAYNKSTNNCSILNSYLNSHQVIIKRNGGFANQYLKEDDHLKTVKHINFLIEYVGEVSFFDVSAFLTKSDAKNELKHEKVRKIVTVVFWKFICIKAGVNFH